MSLRERFWQKVDKKSDPNSCWLWTAARNKGYGVIGRTKATSPKRGNHMATHVSWWVHTGEHVPTGMVVCHKCDNPPCVNPNHLYIGTPRQNAMDMVERNRMGASLRDHAVLTEDDVRAIRQAHEKGSTQVSLAKFYEVSPQCINAVVRRRSWKHV